LFFCRKIFFAITVNSPIRSVYSERDAAAEADETFDPDVVDDVGSVPEDDADVPDD
jgi:hypothetical protein